MDPHKWEAKHVLKQHAQQLAVAIGGNTDH